MAERYTEEPLEVPRYREFAIRIANGDTPRQAMQAAGFDNHALVKKLLRHPKILDFIHRLRQEQIEKLDISRDDVLRGFLSAISDAKALSEPMTQIAGWREIGKFQGQYAPEEVHHKVSGTVEKIERRVSAMPTGRLLELLEQVESGEAVIDIQDIEDAQWTETPSPPSTPVQDVCAPSRTRRSPSSRKSARPGETVSAGAAGGKKKQPVSAKRTSRAGSSAPKASGARKPRKSSGNGKS